MSPNASYAPHQRAQELQCGHEFWLLRRLGEGCAVFLPHPILVYMEDLYRDWKWQCRQPSAGATSHSAIFRASAAR
jgi:hypothetical protein